MINFREKKVCLKFRQYVEWGVSDTFMFNIQTVPAINLKLHLKFSDNLLNCYTFPENLSIVTEINTNYNMFINI